MSRDDRPHSRTLSAVSQRCGAGRSDIAFCPRFVWLLVAVSYLQRSANANVNGGESNEWRTFHN